VGFTARAALSIGGSVAYLGLAVLGFGGLSAFFSHPPLIALTVVFLLLSVAALFAGGSLSAGVREDRSNRWVILALIAIGLAAAYLAPWSDRRGIWTIDGDAIRWLGVLLVAVGGTFRLAPVYILGNRFSGLVAIQPGHTLVTNGLYGYIRHPSYLGLLLGAFGWGLAFRSGIGVLLAAMLIPVIVTRIRSEETLLHTQFGAEYEAYRARTSRLIPGIY
jgi:protein-S-isoprenylcysteine O-methyltransferase Ste14